MKKIFSTTLLLICAGMAQAQLKVDSLGNTYLGWRYVAPSIRDVTTIDAYYTKTPLSIGYNVDSGHPFGNVIVKAGHTLSIKRHAEINLNGGFSVEKGAKLVIQ